MTYRIALASLTLAATAFALQATAAESVGEAASNAAKTTGALAQRRGDLANLVSNANTTAAAIADENASFNQALLLLPGTLRLFEHHEHSLA